MPLVYADTSALFAFFHPSDEFSAILTEAARKHSPDFEGFDFVKKVCSLTPSTKHQGPSRQPDPDFHCNRAR